MGREPQRSAHNNSNAAAHTPLAWMYTVVQGMLAPLARSLEFGMSQLDSSCAVLFASSTCPCAARCATSQGCFRCGCHAGGPACNLCRRQSQSTQPVWGVWGRGGGGGGTCHAKPERHPAVAEVVGKVCDAVVCVLPHARAFDARRQRLQALAPAVPASASAGANRHVGGARGYSSAPQHELDHRPAMPCW